MREDIVKYLNVEVFNLNNEEEKLKKAFDYFKSLSEADKELFLQILINVRERGKSAPVFNTPLFLTQLEESGIPYNYQDVLSHVGDEDYILKHEDILLALAKNTAGLKNFLASSNNHTEAFHILLTLYINDYDINSFTLPKLFDLEGKYFNSHHVQRRIDENLLKNKEDLNVFFENFFNIPYKFDRVHFFIRNEKLNRILLKNPAIKELIISHIEDSDFKFIKHFEHSFEFLKEVESKCKENPCKHALFLSQIMEMCNSNDSIAVQYINDFIINNKDKINKDYKIKGEYTLLYPSYYVKESNYNLLKTQLKIIQEEPIVFSNLINSILDKKETKDAVKLIKNYFKDPKYIKNESRIIEFAENKSIKISSVILSLMSNQRKPLSEIIKNIPVIKTLLKNGEKLDINDFSIIDGIDDSLKYRVNSSEKKEIKKIIELINLFIEYSDINNIFNQTTLLETRSRYIFESLKHHSMKDQLIDFDKLLCYKKMIENKSQFFIFSLDMEKEAIQKNTVIDLNKYLREKRQYIIENSSQEELKDILQALNLKNTEKEFNEIISQIENKIIKISVNEVVSINPIQKRRL